MALACAQRLGGLPIVLGALLLSLAACAPRTGITSAGSASGELQRTALVAFHRMEIAFLETGSYTTNALIDLDLPSGVKWTLEEYSDADYRLRFTDDNRPGTAWLVTPAGVIQAQEAGARKTRARPNAQRLPGTHMPTARTTGAA